MQGPGFEHRPPQKKKNNNKCRFIIKRKRKSVGRAIKLSLKSHFGFTSLKF